MSDLPPIASAASPVTVPAGPVPGSGPETGWRTLAEALDEGVVVGEVIDGADGAPPDCRHLYMNAAWERLTGLEAAPLVGRPVREALPGPDPGWTAALVRVVEEGAPVTLTLPGTATDARRHEARAFPLGGRLFGLFFRDATEREREADARDRRSAAVEAQLVVSLSDRAHVWEVMPELVCIVDYEGRFIHVNPAWERTLGHSPDFLHHAVYSDLLHPEDSERSAAAFQDLVARERPVRGFENRLRHADGGYRRFSWIAVPEDGRIYCSGRDVTAERAREVKLAERNRIWNASPDLYVIVGLDGVYRELNPAWRTELGHDPDALVGTAFDALVHPERLDAVRGEFARMVGGGRVEDYEIPMRGADGTYRRYAFTGFIEGDAVLVMGRDVEGRRRREAELEAAAAALRQSQKLEMIGRLTGGVAHDFNNLLMAMQSSLELLDARLSPDDRESRRLVADALAGTGRGAALTQRMLAFARKQELSPGAVDVPGLVGGMTELLSHSLGPRVRTEVAAAPDVPAAAVDGNQLEMALLNLAVNARDAMEDEGALRFEIASETVTKDEGALSAGAYVRVRLTDDGRGMDAGTLERATEPFFTTKPVGSGTGLGLAMVHGLAEQSGGRFRLASEPGVGTTAEILLPAADGPAPVARPDSAAPAPLAPAAPCRILVVDDDELVLRGMAGILERLGHDVRRASSAALALQGLALEGAVDVVITDQLMPGMTGLELAAAVRREHPGPAIVLATGYSDVADDGGLVDARLVKPFDRARLEAVLAAVRPCG